jgi:hypothetical protein
MLAIHVEFNLARPGWRNVLNLSIGVVREPFQDNGASIFTIALYQSHASLRAGTLHGENAALADEPRWTSNSKLRTTATRLYSRVSDSNNRPDGVAVASL